MTIDDNFNARSSFGHASAKFTPLFAWDRRASARKSIRARWSRVFACKVCAKFDAVAIKASATTLILLHADVAHLAPIIFRGRELMTSWPLVSVLRRALATSERANACYVFRLQHS